MTSVELGETERIANQYCNGNLSKFLRDRIMEYHHKQIRKEEIEKTSNNLFVFQNIVFLFISASFIAMGLSLKFDLLSSITISLLIISAFLLILFVIVNHKKYRLINGKSGV